MLPPTGHAPPGSPGPSAARSLSHREAFTSPSGGKSVSYVPHAFPREGEPAAFRAFAGLGRRSCEGAVCLWPFCCGREVLFLVSYRSFLLRTQALSVLGANTSFRAVCLLALFTFILPFFFMQNFLLFAYSVSLLFCHGCWVCCHTRDVRWAERGCCGQPASPLPAGLQAGGGKPLSATLLSGGGSAQ